MVSDQFSGQVSKSSNHFIFYILGYLFSIGALCNIIMIYHGTGGPIGGR
jgi:hypothetical protein